MLLRCEDLEDLPKARSFFSIIQAMAAPKKKLGLGDGRGLRSGLTLDSLRMDSRGQQNRSRKSGKSLPDFGGKERGPGGEGSHPPETFKCNNKPSHLRCKGSVRVRIELVWRCAEHEFR